MRILFLSLLAVVMLFSDQNLKIYTKEDVKITFKNGAVTYLNKSSGELFTGVVKEHNKKDVLLRETTYKNGKKNGVHKRFSSQGNLVEEISYKYGKKDGFEKNYYKNGSLRYVSSYTNDKKDGISKWYSKEGILTGETPYKMDKKDGMSKTYTDKGVISRERPYKEDKEHGIVKFYDKDGRLQMEIPYRYGKQHGIEKAYEEDGKLNFETPYIDGKLHGIKKIYRKGGKVIEEIPYVNGKKHGLSKMCSKSGKLFYEITYKNGKADGFEREYYNDGSISREQLYKNGMPISGFEYDKNGNKISFEIDKNYNKIILKKRDSMVYKIYDQDVKRGVPPIFAAIQNCLHKELLVILASGTDIEIKNKFGTTPLSFAIYQKDDTIIKILLDHGANPNVIDGNGLYTPLSEAIVSNRESTVDLLLRYNADVNFQSNKSETALTVAAKGCKNFKIVRWLLYKGTDPDLIDRFGFTTKTGLSRHCKKDANYEKMMKLLEDGFDPKLSNAIAPIR